MIFTNTCCNYNIFAQTSARCVFNAATTNNFRRDIDAFVVLKAKKIHRDYFFLI